MTEREGKERALGWRMRKGQRKGWCEGGYWGTTLSAIEDKLEAD